MMHLVKHFEHLKLHLEAIKAATNNFADDNCIGRGGFGKVYKGELVHSKGQSLVAFKRLDPRFGQGNPEFWKEISMLSLYKHENIVSLLGFCDESDEKILVYEYASRRSLDMYLNNKDLSWIQRLKICIGAARGLAFLHNPSGTRTQQRVLHRDIKSSNILLDDNWNAKISDMGLSRFGPANQIYTFLVSNTVGTIGYIDPVYVETGLLTKESDVYSLGVVLFEVLCGRMCICNMDGNHQSLIGLVRRCYAQNKISEIVFESVKDIIKPKSLQMFTEIAYQCLKRDVGERPLMADVVQKLEKVLDHEIGPKIHVIVGDCALFKPSNDSPPLVGIIRRLDKEDNQTLSVNWLYPPSEVKLSKESSLKAAENEVFYSFHQDEIPAASLLHPVKVAFLGKGATLPSREYSYVCRRVYDVQSKSLWWLNDQDYHNELQQVVNQLLDKTRIEMYGSRHFPKTFKGKKTEQSSDSGQLRSEDSIKAEIAEITDKGGLVEDEELATAIQESLKINSPPRNNHGSLFPSLPNSFSGVYRICAGCNGEISHGRFLSCMGGVWHPECFRCHACNIPISDYEFSMSENRPFHKSCYKELHHPKCDVCKSFIPTNGDGLIEYRAHPFWLQKYCPAHEHDGTPQCCSCERMEPRDTRYLLLDDDRDLCLECLDSSIMDTHQCQPLYLEIQDFYEGLNMKIEQQVPLLLVERQALNEAMEGEKHGPHHMPGTRGLCLSEEQTISTIIRRPRVGAGRIIDMFTEPYKLVRKCEVTAILILYSLPRLLTGSILAHEMMHAWLRLKGYSNLPPDVEEGICQVLAHMWLDSEIMAGSSCTSVASSSYSSAAPVATSSKKGKRSDFEKQLGEFFKHQIELDMSAVFGDGFREGNKAVLKYGLRSTLEHIRLTGRFPC